MLFLQLFQRFEQFFWYDLVMALLKRGRATLLWLLRHICNMIDVFIQEFIRNLVVIRFDPMGCLITMPEELFIGWIFGKEFVRICFGVVVETKAFQLLFSLLHARGLQKAVQGVLFFQRFLLDVKGILEVLRLHPPRHVFAEKGLDVLLLCVSVHAPARGDNNVASIIELRHVNIWTEHASDGFVKRREVVRIIIL